VLVILLCIIGFYALPKKNSFFIAKKTLNTKTGIEVKGAGRFSLETCKPLIHYHHSKTAPKLDSFSVCWNHAISITVTFLAILMRSLVSVVFQ
jgi:hypothetical protein